MPLSKADKKLLIGMLRHESMQHCGDMFLLDFLPDEEDRIEVLKAIRGQDFDHERAAKNNFNDVDQYGVLVHLIERLGEDNV